MSRGFEIETNSEVVKIELVSDDEHEPTIDDIPDEFLLNDWNDFSSTKEIPSTNSSHGFVSENNSPVEANNCVKDEPQDAMDWNPHLTETGNRGVVDLLPPRVCVGSELGKDERDRIFRDGLNFVHEFQSWRPSLVIEPKPGNIYFCKGQLSDRGKFHGADGVSWTSSGRSLENPRKAVKSFYYVASPDYRKMTREQKEIYWAEPDQPKSKVFTKKITYRKIISFHEKEYFFMIEYFGDDKALPWTPRKNLSHLNRKPSSAKLERCSAKTDRKLQTQPVVVLEKVTARPEKINPPLEAGPKVAKAVVFKTVEPLNKLVDQKEINDMLSRNPFGAMVNDALATKIVNPRAGEIYLMNLSNLDSWSGIYHCDSHSWRLRNIQTWKDYGHITFHFIFIKNAKPFSDFKKTIHFNALTKMKLIQYHGSDAGVPRSEKLYRLPSFQECVERQPKLSQLPNIKREDFFDSF